MIFVQHRLAAARLGLAPALLLFVLALAVAVQPAGARESLRFGQGLLWKVETHGRAPSYVFGTMHASDPEVLDVPAAVLSAFDAADSLTLEMVANEEVPRKMAEAMLLNDGRTLDAIIGAERFAAVAAVGAKYGMPPASLRNFRPWAAMTVFSIAPAEFARLGTGALPLDQALQALGQKKGLTIHGLESVEEQIAVFSGVSEDEQVALLELAVREHGQIDSWYAKLKRAYLAADTDAIYQLMRAHAAGTDASLIRSFERRLIELRNNRMAARMTPRLDEGKAFIAVGALHLPGERGVLALLERQGRKVTRVY